MTIDNHCDGDDQYHSAPASHAEAHSRIAFEQSALFAARLAIARWSRTSADAETAPGFPAAPRAQATWYAEAQLNLQQWLGRGGFAQYPDDCADLITPTLYTIRAASARPGRSDIASSTG